MNNQNKEEKLASVQQYLPVSEIREGICLLKNGGLRAVLLVRGTNFGLKSEAEQNAIIYAYQGFLNSLNFPIQILVRSRKIDLTPYLKRLEGFEKNQGNELLRLQTLEYRDFVSRLIEVCNVMSKEFYVVCSYNPPVIQKEGFFSQIFSFLPGKEKEETKQLEADIQVLKERTGEVISGLEGVGLKVVQLNTEALIELFYNIYNPEISYQERLQEIPRLVGEFVEKTKS